MRAVLHALPFAILFATLVSTASVNAADQPKLQQADTPKEPPPPLFRKHHRGIYKNNSGLEVVDATPQSPPLDIDDPGVPDVGECEINFTTNADVLRDTQRWNLFSVDANYGVLPRIMGHEFPTQLTVEVSLDGLHEEGLPFVSGIGAAKIGLKLNFYNNEYRGLWVSFYPQLEFVPPGTRAIEKGLADPGQTVILPLLAQKELKYLTLVTNAAVSMPTHDPERETLGSVGIGVGRAMTQHLAAMVEIRGQSTLSFARERQLLLNVGVMRGIGGNRVLYAKAGRDILSEDDVRHFYLGIGIKILFLPGERKAH